MANRPAPALVLREGDLEQLRRLTRSSTVKAGLAQRARIVLLAAEGVSSTQIAQTVGGSRPTVLAWRDRCQAKGIEGTVKLPTDPELVAKVTDVVGLYLEPPENAVVLCVDENSQIPGAGSHRAAAADAARSARAPHPGLQAPRDLHLVRRPGDRHQEFLAFLRQVSRVYPDQELHVVMDNYAAHKTPEVRDWLTANPRVQVHFTSTSASWLNLVEVWVEVWFPIIERQAIHRGSFGSVKDLKARIRAFIKAGATAAIPSSGPRPRRRSSRRQTVKPSQAHATSLDVSSGW